MAVRPRNCGAVLVTVTTIHRVSVNTKPPKQNHALQMVTLFPSPLWGGVRGGGRAKCTQGAQRPTPTPALPTRGREKKGYAAAAAFLAATIWSAVRPVR